MFIQKRSTSFIIVGLVYLLATVVGLYTYDVLNYDLWLNILIADVVATIFVFAFSLIFKNASVYDPYWSVQPIVIVVAISFRVKFTLTTFLTLFVVCLWGIRLTANWAYTFHGLKFQDWRYTMLSEKTKVFYPIINFIGIHLVPTLVVYLAVMPAVILMLENPQLNLLSIVGVVVCLTAVTLQTVSDTQMHKYRKNKTTPFIRVGLWKYSRHPNYLGEILMWWGVAMLAFANLPDKIWLLTGAFVNTLLFSLVSIPMAENKQSQKQGYQEYKHDTRVLLPIPKK